MYVFNYQAQSYRSRGIISPLTAKPGQKLLLGGGWTLAACQGQGMKHLGYRVIPVAARRRESDAINTKFSAFKTKDILACFLGFSSMIFCPLPGACVHLSASARNLVCRRW
ncbi:hypothetical protein ILYODFUR_027300 [Ilyodon furcidens]|uniref:Uncharacterized protein n=1 Tax=Ilyodon furcidens TaxID=33524 RepID=A0ABV0T2A1_9TELE